MSLIMPFIVAALLGNLVLVVVFAWLWRERRMQGLFYWMLSFVAGAARYVFGLFAAYDEGSFAFYALHQVATAASALFFLAGIMAFVERSMPKAGIVVVVAALAWSFHAHIDHRSFALTTAPLFFTLGVITIVGGILLLRQRDERSLGRRVAGVALVVHGLHRFDYPFLRDEPFFAPIGFLIAALCELSVGVGFVVAVFERTRREALAHEERYRAFFVGSPAGFFRVDAAGRLVDANPAFLRMLGCHTLDEAQALVGTSVRLDALPEEGAGQVEHGLELALEWRKPHGEPVLVSGARRDVVDEDGTLTAREGFVRDVTRERRLDAELKHAQRSEVVGRLAGGIAHDFNNLLTVVTGNVALLRDDRALSPAARELVDEIDDAASQAGALTRQILALARKTPFTREPVDLAALARRNRAVLKRLVGGAVKLTIVDQGSARVLANAGHLDQVLLNLVINARDAMPEGGEITIATSVDRDTREARITVTDNGVGIAPELLDHIFEPFFTTKEVGQGTGLGLPVVESIIAQLGGSISVRSTPGEGTTFTVRLPILDENGAAASAREETPSRAAQPREAPSGRAPIRLLLVDDDPAIGRLMERGLRARGVSVTTCDRAAAALAILDDGASFDVVASDITMPEMDGIAFARVLAERHPSLPIILISGYAERADELRGATSTRVLEKPFTVERLLAVVEEAVASVLPPSAP